MALITVNTHDSAFINTLHCQKTPTTKSSQTENMCWKQRLNCYYYFAVGLKFASLLLDKSRIASIAPIVSEVLLAPSNTNYPAGIAVVIVAIKSGSHIIRLDSCLITIKLGLPSNTDTISEEN